MGKRDQIETSRRNFIKTTGVSAAALTLGAGILTDTTPVFAAEKGVEDGKESLFESADSRKSTGLSVSTVGCAGPPLADGHTTWPSTLVQFDDKKFLCDCGAAATHGLLLAGVKPIEVKNLLFTHHHADHNSDYFTYAIGGWAGPKGRRVSNIVGPRKTKELHEMMLKFYEEDIKYRMDYGWSGDGLVSNVNIRTVKGGEEFELDGVKITTTTGIHTMEDIVYRFDYKGQSVVVTGDSAYTENIAEISKGVDILVIDAHMAEGTFATEILSRKTNRENMRKAHMSNEDIAKIVAKAQPKQVVLTHLPPGKIDVEATIKVVRSEGYKGKVEVAQPQEWYKA
jgi:ribonuclease BN (tRNA processing enzyme)